LLLALVGAAVADAAISRHRLRHGLARELRSAGGQSGAWVMDVDARRSPLLFSSAPRTKRILASNTKLFTTSGLLAKFGADRHFVTGAWRLGQIAGRHDQILRGRLALVGAGDPALGSRAFARQHNVPLTPLRNVAGDVRRSGIRAIRGGIVADDTVFDRRRGVAATGWAPSVDLSPLSGLSYDSGYAGGHYAADPALVAGKALKRGLKAAGVRVRGHVRVADTPNAIRRRPPLGQVSSPSVSSLITATNKPSNNFYAEMLLKRLAAHPDGGGTTARGARLAERFAHRLGSDVDMNDGSGLSRADRSAPRNVGRLLVAMTHRAGGTAFRHSLAVAGRDGTLRDRMRGTPAAGRCFAKTGTLSDVSALSGYCRAGHGLVAFSILMNSVNVDAARDAQDHMAALIARYRR